MSYAEFPVYIALGSNIGNREGHLQRALEALEFIAASAIRSSRVYETAPVGPGPQGPYLNLCVHFETRLPPRELLEFLKETEVQLGRIPRGPWEAREIDLDLLIHGDSRLSEPDLVLPHPRLAERQFVLRPLCDLAPDLVPPGLGAPAWELLRALEKREGRAAMREKALPPRSSALFPETLRYICIEGVIGVGKTTLVKMLAARSGCSAVYEEFENNPFLSSFYGDRSRHAFQTQLFFLLSRYRQIQESFQQQDLFRTQVVADYMFAKDRIFAAVNLDENEISLYDRLSGILAKNLVRPDYVVYLQADTPTLLSRIRQRDRHYERDIDPGYIDALNRAYNEFFHYYSDSPLLIVNTNGIDFVRHPSDFQSLMARILQAPAGKTYFSPAPSVL